MVIVAPTRQEHQGKRECELGSSKNEVVVVVSAPPKRWPNLKRGGGSGGRERKGRGGLVVGRVLMPFILCELGQKVL